MGGIAGNSGRGWLRRYFDAVEQADLAMAEMASLDAEGAGHGRTLGATLVKMIDEYAPHAGKAPMPRFATLGEIIR